MLTWIFLLIFQGISGGIAGYITNKYAVNMLFKEYTPLKLGGVIKKKREKFIEEISELVERDIINSETIKSEISNKNFNKYMKQISETFFRTSLKDALGNTKIYEIMDFSNSIDKNQKFIAQNLNEILPEALDNIFVNINIEDLLTENQILKIAECIYDLLLEEFNEDNTLKEFIENFYKQNSNITLSSIFSEDVQKKLIKNIIERVMEIIKEDILSDEQQCKEFFEKIFSSINIDLTLVKLQGLIEDSEINRFITNSEEEELTLKIFRKINEFIKSEKGKKSINNLINEIFLIAKNIDFTIYELLPQEMEKSLTEFIKTIVPKVMPYVSNWILSNKSLLDEMIEDSIDEAIDGIDGNIKRIIISKVRSALMGDISSENNIVKKIIDYLNDNLHDESYSKLANSIIKYLKNKKIKDIIELIEKQSMFDSVKVTNLIIEQFDSHGKKLLDIIIKSQFSKKIHNFVKFDLVELFHEKLEPILYSNIFNNKNKLIKKINNLIEEFIVSKSNEIFNKKLSQLFTENDISNISNLIKKSTGKLFKDKASTYKIKVKQFLYLKVKNINLLSALNGYKVDISNFIVDNTIEIHKETVDRYKDYELKDIISKYFNKNNLSNLLINEGYPMLIDKLPNLLDGNIKKFVGNNLRKYDEDEICNMVQDFMGDQLKPLSVFGGVLGVIVGVLYGMAYPDSIGRYGFPSSILSMVISCVIMAIIGYITNVIALWMIFHPYKENKIMSKIPFLNKFALGYIPAHKNDFAISMAKLIDRELLNKEEINKVFNLQKNNIKLSLTSLVTNNNYKVLRNLLRSKKKNLTRYIYDKAMSYCSKNSYVSKRILKFITNTKLDKFIKKADVLNMVPLVISNINNIENSLVQTVNNKLNSNYKFSDVLPQTVSYGIEEYVKDQINILIQEQISNSQNTDFIEMLVKNYNIDYEIGIKKSCKEIFNEELSQTVKNNLETKVEVYIFNDLKIHVSDFTKQFLRSGLDDNNNIGSMFDGKIKDIIDNNLYSLTNYLTDKLISYLKRHEYELSVKVQENIKNELNFFEKIAYSTFGGDDIANKAVSIMLNEKLPVMIKQETNKIASIAKVTLDKSIYPMKTSTLKIKADEINTVMFVDNIFEQFSNSNYIQKYIHNASNVLIDYFMSMPLIKYFEIFNLHSLDLVYKKFYNEISIVKEDIYNNLSDINNIEFPKLAGEFLNKKLILPLFNSYNSQIFKDINSSDIEYSMKNILNLISSNEQTKNYLTLFLEKIYDNIISKLEIKQIIDEEMLNKDMEKIINSIFAKESFNETNIRLIEKIIQNTIDNNLDIVTKDTKYYLTNKTIEASLDSISNQIVPILQEVNLEGITNRQIHLLNPAEIDMLFNSFAGDFFNKLRIYGVFGFVFGIHSALSIVLWAIDLKYGNSSSSKDLDTLEDS